MEHKFVGVLLLLLPFSFCIGQAVELSNNDKVPNIKLNVLMTDGTDKKTTLYTLKKKLLLLDFWSTDCGACIEAFPMMDSLQKQFADRIQIIAVNSESRQKTMDFFKKHPRVKRPGVMMVTGDVLLANYFPRNFVPWQVWIDSNFIVRSITSQEYASAENFRSYLAGQLPSMRQFTYYGDYSGEKPLIAEGNGRFANKAVYFSYIMHCIEGASAHNLAMPPTSESPQFRLSRNCSSIRGLYEIAYGEGGKKDLRARAMIDLQVTDSARYVYPVDNAGMTKWIYEDSYDYDLLVPASRAGRVYEFMKQDLARFFNLNANFVHKEVKCFVLEQLPGDDKLIAIGGNEKTNIGYTPEGTDYYGTNIPFKYLADFLSNMLLRQFNIDLPFICLVPGDKRINISFNKEAMDTKNLKLLQEELQKWNLQLAVKYYPVDVLVLSEPERN